MAILTIRQKSETRTAEFTPPLLLSDALQRAGVLLDHPCGRRGVCGKCGVTLKEGAKFCPDCGTPVPQKEERPMFRPIPPSAEQKPAQEQK